MIIRVRLYSLSLKGVRSYLSSRRIIGTVGRQQKQLLCQEWMQAESLELLFSPRQPSFISLSIKCPLKYLFIHITVVLGVQSLTFREQDFAVLLRPG